MVNQQIPCLASRFHSFKDRQFWVDEEEAIETFISVVALICVEIKQKDVIQEQIYSQIEKFFTVTTETRKATKTTENKARETSVFQEPLLVMKDMTQGVYGGHNRSNWLRTTQRQERAPEVETSEGILITDTDGKLKMAPNWIRTEDPNGIARLINSFPSVQIKFNEYLPLIEKSGIFISIFSPATTLVWDEETGEKVWKGRTEVIREEMEKQGIVPQIEEVDDDITEKEYNRLKALDPNSVAENWQVERLTRKKKSILKEISRISGDFRNKLIMRLTCVEGLTEAFKTNYLMPPVGDKNEKLSSTADVEDWDEATFWGRINQTIGYHRFKSRFADFIDGYNDLVEDDIDIPSQMFLLVGSAGTGKTHIAEAIAGATGLPIETISMNGKKETSIYFGVPQEYLGSGFGEIIKGMSKNKTKTMIFVFDEIDKCAKDVQQVLGNITDKKLNKKFKDVFLDYPIPINQIIVFATANYPEDIEPFLFSRLTPIMILPNTFDERIEIANDLLRFNFKKYRILNLLGKVTRNLIKRMLTWEVGVRGMIDNVEKFSYKVWLDNKRNRLPEDWDNYSDWPFVQKLELDAGSVERNRPICPVYTNHNAQHRDGCECFRPNEIEGWVAEMGSSYPNVLSS
jgi:hypothetical protein